MPIPSLLISLTMNMMRKINIAMIKQNNKLLYGEGIPNVFSMKSKISAIIDKLCVIFSSVLNAFSYRHINVVHNSLSILTSYSPSMP